MPELTDQRIHTYQEYLDRFFADAEPGQAQRSPDVLDFYAIGQQLASHVITTHTAVPSALSI